MTELRRTLAVFLTVGLTFGLCGAAANAASTGNESSTPTVKSLLDSSFRSFKVEGTPGIKPRAVTMSFFLHTPRPRQERGRPAVAYSAGCNHFGSRFKINKGQFSLTDGGSGTDMACPVNHDLWFTKQLRKGVKIQSVGRRLILSRPTEGIRIILREVPGPRPSSPFITAPATEAKLKGRRYLSRGVSRLKLRAAAKLNFTTGSVSPNDADGPRTGPWLGARLDCNGAGGRYRIKNRRLIWENYTHTKVRCEDSNEQVLFRFLTSKPRIAFSYESLVIWRGNKKLTLAQVNP